VKNEPDLSYLFSLRPAFTIMHLMITCIRAVLIPLASGNVTIRRDMEQTTTLTMTRMEDKVNTLLQRTIDVVLTWVAKILATQKKIDFRPRDDALGSSGGAWLEMLQTPTCQTLSTFLATKLHPLAVNALPPPSPNLTHFLTEVGLGIRSQLLEHFKKFPVNATGGIMATKDISKYLEISRGWEVEEGFKESLEVLTEIGNVFVVGPEALRERLRKNGGKGGWDGADLRVYVGRREDVGSVGVQSALGGL